MPRYDDHDIDCNNHNNNNEDNNHEPVIVKWRRLNLISFKIHSKRIRIMRISFMYSFSRVTHLGPIRSQWAIYELFSSQAILQSHARICNVINNRTII